jgi:hypothetical protein
MTDTPKDEVRKHMLELTTDVEPAKTFTVDGTEYKLFGLGHLDKDSETKVMGTFARYESIQERITDAQSDEQAERFATKLHDLRIDVFCILTTLERDTAEKLPLSAQTRLMSALQEEIIDSGGADVDGLR